MYWTIAILGGLGLGVGGFFAARSSKFWIGMVKDLWSEFYPSFLKMIRPKDLTEEQKQTIRQAGDPFKLPTQTKDK